MQKEDIQIVLSSHDYSYDAVVAEGYRTDGPYLGNRLFFRLLREVWFRLKLPGRAIWYNRRVNHGAKFLLVYDALITTDYLRWLREHNPDSRIVYFYTNPVSKAIFPDEISDQWCEKWSSDAADCKTYKLHLQCIGGYPRLWKVEKRTPEFDVFYIGRDKGRLQKLLTIKKDFEDLGLRTNFYITAYHRQQRFQNPIYRALIPYADVLKLLGGTRAILHITEGGQTGVTIRVLESMIHQIKLITDNVSIMDTVAYHPNNVFILGRDRLCDLPDFLDKPFVPYDSELIESLYYDHFINNITEDERSLGKSAVAP